MERDKQGARLPPGGISLVKMSDVGRRLNISKRRIRQQVSAMLQKRTAYETRWKAIRDYQLPYIGYFDDRDDEQTMADRKDRHIYNSTTWQANQIFAAGVMSGLTPPSRKWFRLSFSNKELTDNSNVGKLLDQRMDIMNDVLEKSNFYTAIHSCYLELAFGQAPLGIFPDSRYGVHFTAYPVGSYAYECGPDGLVNTFVHRMKMSAQQLVDKFGRENVTQAVRDEIDNGAGVRAVHRVVWFVTPNRLAAPDKLGSIYMPYLSAYYLEESDEDEFLYLGGFEEWPVPVARYIITGNDAYGKGPGWYAEGDAKALQLMEKDLLTAVELGVKPPMQTTAETVAKGINLVPGGKTYVRQDGAVKPLFQVQTDIGDLRAQITQLEDRIKEAYNANLFMMLNEMEDKTMTAREVIERNQEKMTVLGPVVQRMQYEFLSKIIERVYMVLDRAQVFPQPEDPAMQEMLAQQDIKIEYISPLAQAQKVAGLTNIEQFYAFLMNLAQANPDVIDKLNFPETVNRYADMLGTPVAILRTDDEYEKIQQEKAEKQDQMEQLQQAKQVADMAAPAAQAAKNAAQAAQDGNPALQQLMGADTLGYGQGG